MERTSLFIKKNIDATLFRTFSHVIIMMPKSGSTLKVKGQGFIKGKLYQRDRHTPRIRKSLTNINL